MTLFYILHLATKFVSCTFARLNYLDADNAFYHMCNTSISYFKNINMLDKNILFKIKIKISSSTMLLMILSLLLCLLIMALLSHLFF